MARRFVEHTNARGDSNFFAVNPNDLFAIKQWAAQR